MRIFRVVGSRTLDCGCFVGRYEAYCGQVHEIIDCRGPGCPRPDHRNGRDVSSRAASAVAVTVDRGFRTHRRAG